MPQSLSLTLVHLFFSTKDLTPFLTLDVRPDLHAYLATVARHGDGECYRAGGVTDHVHLAIRLSRTISIADLVSELKTSSSKWLKDRSPALSKFAWQRGYASFSIGPWIGSVPARSHPSRFLARNKPGNWPSGNFAILVLGRWPRSSSPRNPLRPKARSIRTPITLPPPPCRNPSA